MLQSLIPSSWTASWPSPDSHVWRRGLIAIAAGGLAAGLAATAFGVPWLAAICWQGATIPVLAALLFSIIRELREGRTGVDAVALVSMSAALLLGEPLAAGVVALMYAGGTALEDYAITRAERDLRALLDRAPSIAHLVTKDGVTDVSVSSLKPGDRVLVRAGEVIPIDGALVTARAQIDEQALTGEPLPVGKARGDTLNSGTVNAGETVELVATVSASESTYAGIIRMVTAAQTTRAPFVRMADRYALVLLPVSLITAAAAWAWSGDATRGLAVMLAATPCPLILAVPVAFIAGAARAAKLGILIKGGAPLEALARVRTALFDKTGTLTVGGARLVAIETAPGTAADEVLRVAASLEQASHHILAEAVTTAAQAKALQLVMPLEPRETMGAGIAGQLDGRPARAGSLTYVYGGRRIDDWARRAARRGAWRSAMAVFVSIDGSPIGALLMGDELRREAPSAIQALRASGIKRLVMVTGDRAESAETMAAALDLDAVLAERVPSDKVDAVKVERRTAAVMMVGDGINDAPALAAADVGVAMGARGASASSQAADVVILTDRLDRICDAVRIARRTYRIATQSVLVGLGLSAATMAGAAAGVLSPVACALIQEAIDVAVILNALRALGSGMQWSQPRMSNEHALALRHDHQALEADLDRLRTITDALDAAAPDRAAALIIEAETIVRERIVVHERDDEAKVYPYLTRFLSDGHGLSAMSRAHREIIHLSRLLGRLRGAIEEDGSPLDEFAIRDGQRVIESVEALVRLHNAQEEDIYDHASAS